MEFNGCARPTVGVEWELQLLDSETLDLYDGIMPLMEFFPDTNFVKPEYIQSCVELTSCVADNSTEAVAHIQHTLTSVLQRCSELGMSICGAGTHPFCRRLALITPMPRYLRIEKRSGYLAQAQITFSSHVHVGMRSGNETIRAMSNLVPALPALIALSANSPFWRGHETGHVAYRHRILAAAPNYGLPVEFRDWSDFSEFYRVSTNAGLIRGLGDIHWDIRPHPDFGTIELRTMDAASDARTLSALVAFARAMVVSMARSSTEDVGRVLPLDLPAWIKKENCYRASRLGLDATFIHTQDGQQRPLRSLIEDLIDFCEPVAMEIDEAQNLSLVRQVLLKKPGYTHQLDAYAESHSVRTVVENLRTRLAANPIDADEVRKETARC